MVTLETDEVRKTLIELKLQIDKIEEMTSCAMSAVYHLEDQLLDTDDLAYHLRYGFLSGVSNNVG